MNETERRGLRRLIDQAVRARDVEEIAAAEDRAGNRPDVLEGRDGVELVSPEEARRRLGKSPTAFQAFVQKGRLPSVWDGDDRWIPADVLPEAKPDADPYEALAAAVRGARERTAA